MLWANKRHIYTIDFMYYDGWHFLIQTKNKHKIDFNKLLRVTTKKTRFIISYWDVSKATSMKGWCYYDYSRNCDTPIYASSCQVCPANLSKDDDYVDRDMLKYKLDFR